MNLLKQILATGATLACLAGLAGGDGTVPKPDYKGKKAILKVETGAYATRGIAAGDMDGDGLVDILSTNALGFVYVHKGFGDGFYIKLDQAIMQIPTGPFGTRALAAADMNGDGLADLLVTDNDGNVYLHKNLGNYKFE